MKIAIVVSTFPPYKGGMGNVAYFHAKELSKLGEDVTVFCPKPKTGVLEKENFKIRYLRPIFRYGNAAWVPQLALKLKNFDLVHLHYPFFGGAEAVYFWKKKNPQKKLFMTYHMDTVGSGWLNRLFRIYKKVFFPRIVRAADKVLVSTLDYAHAGDLAKFLAQDPERFIVSNLGVDFSFFSPGPKPETLIQELGLTSKDFILLFVGGLDRAHYFKGLDYLLQALSKLENPDIKLVVVGEGGLKPQFMAKARELNIEKMVAFAGEVSNQELVDYYRLCDAFVFPSTDKSEAYGLAALEAGACAKPVIASSLPGVRHVVLDQRTGYLVEPKDVDTLAEKINYFVKHPDKAEQLGKNARERIVSEFTWQAIVEKMRNLYYL